MGLAVTGFAVPVVSWETLRAWCELRQIGLAPWEAITLVRLGALRASVITGDNTAPAPKPPRRNKKQGGGQT